MNFTSINWLDNRATPAKMTAFCLQPYLWLLTNNNSAGFAQ